MCGEINRAVPLDHLLPEYWLEGSRGRTMVVRVYGRACMCSLFTGHPSKLLCRQVYQVPETATILLSGGVAWPELSVEKGGWVGG